jgi:hypothetical protein
MKFREYITEKASIYDNNKGDTAKVYDRGSGFYVEVNNKYDMNFKNKKELDKWLKKEKYEWVGMD